MLTDYNVLKKWQGDNDFAFTHCLYVVLWIHDIDAICIRMYTYGFMVHFDGLKIYAIG